MMNVPDLDPAFLARLRMEEPRLRPRHLRMARLAYGSETDALASIDAEIEVLAARRRAVLDRLAALRPRLWPESHRRHVRRRCRVDERALPPAVVGAETLVGVELRRVMVGIVRRHGDVTLRELHGLLHRYGYELGSDRPVQRLGDAAAYEAREGRLRRVARGVYGPGPVHGTDIDLADPLPWDAPDPDSPPPVDPAIADDADRWSDQRWPAHAQAGSGFLAPPVDPVHRSLGEDLVAHVTATRHRLAALIEARHQATAPDARRTPPPDLRPDPDGDTLGADSLTNRSPRSADGDAGGGDGRRGDRGVP